MGAKPIVSVDQVKDLVIQKNFKNLLEYFQTQNQLQDFNFLDLTFTDSVLNFKVAHGLSEIPQDIIMTRITGPGICQFNHGLFDATNINISTSDACRVRFFIGKYWKSKSITNIASDEFTQYCQSIIPGQVINSTTINNFASPITLVNSASTATGTASSSDIVYEREFLANEYYPRFSGAIQVDGYLRFPFNATITDVIIHHDTAGSSGTTQADLKYATSTTSGFISILSTKPSIASNAVQGSFCGMGETVVGCIPAVLAKTDFNAGDVVRMDLVTVQAGSPRNFGLIVKYIRRYP